ncbi:hypothetical protein D9757_014093 [Collybiopsis confluens]|uniref:Uncharacterized protein n=1 Tax=Collybiopsis confluens TaxID=2823264 RepID=A0A8H5CN20_9AGAR|nr:hypothetical protein D9757_014093 [Collybiopsis confluens]
MGQWTLTRYDEVLNSKIKSLVAGAMKRAKLEQAEPQISFKQFVEDLDVGDSFTTSLVDTLVKEMADRRTRPTEDDRRLVSEKTAKNLRTITGANRVYFTSRFRRLSNSRGHLPMYLTTNSPEEMEMDDDEEEFDSILDAEPTLSRVGADSSVVTTGGSSTGIRFRSTSPATLAVSDETSTAPFSRSWILPRSHVTSGHSLTRSSSIRRPTRSRTVDFNDFTSRRRSTIRNNTDTSGGTNAESSTSSVDSGVGTAHRRADTDSHIWSDLPDDFVPASLRRSDVDNPPDSEIAEERSSGGLDRTISNRFPRLRRGGLRAPESLLSRQASPVETVVPGDSDSRRAPSPPEISEFVVFDSPRFSSIPIQEPESGATFGVEVTSYPTPETTFDNESPS